MRPKKMKGQLLHVEEARKLTNTKATNGLNEIELRKMSYSVLKKLGE